MNRKLMSVLFLLVMGGGALMLAACHTVEGAGRDVGAAGEGVAETAERARPYD